MDIFLYNTLSRQKEKFIPIDPELVRMYSCGPTVYSRQHLGNLRAAFLVDLYKNILKHVAGYAVRHVINITDVGHLTGDNEGDADHGEDRMEKGARREGVTAREIAKKYTDMYLQDLETLRIEPFRFFSSREGIDEAGSVNIMCRATDHITQQIEMIKELETKGYTYIIPGDGVYMDTSKVTDYGQLIGKKHLEGIEQGVRIDDVGKRHATDFALRKYNITGKKRDMERNSPWGVGFPGRHIECSAMSIFYLGDQIDIHTGGMEHIPIHHTNEICQSECSHGHVPRVNYWMHNQRLMMNGKKIAKSDGNVAYMGEVIEKGYTGEDLRYFFLQAHYRSFQDFTREGLEAARKGRLTLKRKVQEQGELQDVQKLEELRTVLADDFDTPRFLALAHTHGVSHELDEHILKLGLFEPDEEVAVPAEIQALAQQRLEAKRNKDFARADTLRKQLSEAGREIRDTADGYEVVKG